MNKRFIEFLIEASSPDFINPRQEQALSGLYDVLDKYAKLNTDISNK